MQGSFAAAGAKYVSGDITFNIGMTSGDAIDESLGVAATSLKTQWIKSQQALIML